MADASPGAGGGWSDLAVSGGGEGVSATGELCDGGVCLRWVIQRALNRFNRAIAMPSTDFAW
jgi:hypothetical protein